MILYPYTTPIIMTDEIFSRLGGNIDNTPFDLRQMAYVIAESAVYYDLDTPLRSTVFTGTYAFSPRLILDHAYVDHVIASQFVGQDETILETVSGTANYYVHLDDRNIGLVSFTPYTYQVCNPFGRVDKVNVVYQAGIPSGTSYDPRILMGIAKYAMIQINEMIGFGNESTGDVGVDTFKTLDYFEKRTPLLRTAYGNSAQAQYIHNLLSPYRKRRYVGW